VSRYRERGSCRSAGRRPADLAIARDLLDRGDADDASASRAYYAMFDAAEALLLSRGEAFSRNQGVIAAFGRDFARTGELPVELHGFLTEAFRLRQIADYTRGRSVSPEDAAFTLDRAQQFIDTVADYLHEHDGC
jgi:uncharacterized protein (UPF0332 family)